MQADPPAADLRAANPAGALIIETVTDPALADEIAGLAAATFPLACPPHVDPVDIATHITEALSPQRFSAWIDDEVHEVLIARDRSDGRLIGYCLLVHRPPADEAVRALLPDGPSAEISKMYVLPADHAAERPDRPAHALMAAALHSARTRGAETVWLGVNQLNERALRYYRKMGFTRAGQRTFDLNGSIEQDYVMTTQTDR